MSKDFVSDWVGAGSGSMPEKSLATLVMTEADAGVICSNSSIPIEISKRRATEDFYNPMDMVCQNCGRCQ